MAANDPIHQFQIIDLFPVTKIGNSEIVFTNSAAFMFAAVIIITAFLVIGTAKRSLVPSRLQSAAEISYEFVATTVRSTAGSEGMRFFPFVFTIFMFVLTLNFIGLIPYTFTVTSHIIVTAALAITVFLTVLGYGLYRHGLHFFNLFVPKGVPVYILPLIVFIEVLSFVSRPISHSVRLFANMLAGHITLKVFAGFIILMGSAMGALGWAGGILPFGMIVILTALETLVAFLQAYVFAILTCIYLNDAIHPGH
jgi:F-type H+-transporting ATPase subunit a